MNSTRNKDFNIFFTKLNGKFLAATNCSPYFCFEASSEKELYIKLKQARVFCENVVKRHKAALLVHQP